MIKLKIFNMQRRHRNPEYFAKIIMAYRYNNDSDIMGISREKLGEHIDETKSQLDMMFQWRKKIKPLSTINSHIIIYGEKTQRRILAAMNMMSQDPKYGFTILGVDMKYLYDTKFSRSFVFYDVEGILPPRFWGLARR